MVFEAQKFISAKIATLPPSGIFDFLDVVKQYQDVISLGVGEPDFVTPAGFFQAGIEAFHHGYTTYTASRGIIELRKAISQYLAQSFHLDYDYSKEILVTVGGSEAIFVVMQTLFNDGDELLLLDPGYVSYAPAAILSNVVPVAVPTYAEDDFQLSVQVLEKYLTPKTKGILINFPCNPTGATMSQEKLQQLADFAIQHDLMVISDEIYAELTFVGQHLSIAQFPGMKDRTVVISGASKAFAMTGCRIGYICANQEIIDNCDIVHQYVVMCCPTNSQYMAVEAFTNGKQEVQRMWSEYAVRREYILNRLVGMGLKVPAPNGAFYVFPDISPTGLSSQDFADKLLTEEKVFAVPGIYFGSQGANYLRCSYATSQEQLIIACDRIENFLNRYSK